MRPEIPRFVYFDLGNVLLKFERETASEQVGQLAGVPAERVRDVLFTSGLQERYERGAVSSEAFYEAFCAATAARPDYEAFHGAHSRMFELNVPVIPIVVQLRAACYDLGILSNTCEAHWAHISDGRFGVITTHFDVRVLSFQEGCMKPAREIFRKAIERASTDPSGIVLIDDRAENVAVAHQCGLRTVLFESPAQLAMDLHKLGLDFNY